MSDAQERVWEERVEAANVMLGQVAQKRAELERDRARLIATEENLKALRAEAQRILRDLTNSNEMATP